MKIENLYLYHFRNYEEIEFEFNASTNILIGHNAQGKTNLLESIYLLSLAKSFKTSNTIEMIKFDQLYSKIISYAFIQGRRKRLEFILSKEGKKAKIDHKEIQKTSDFVGVLNVVTFTPEDLYLIKGGPKERRHFIDVELSKISPVYLYNLNKFYRLLKERNQYLKILNMNHKTGDDYLDILDEQMASLQKEIIIKRIQFIKDLNIYLNKTYEFIASSNEKTEIIYKSFIKESDEDLYLSILNHFKENRERDIKYMKTQSGIHRDDLGFLLNGLDANAFASQGQQRSIILSVKIALLDLIKNDIGEYPILLLDDVLSELDDQRKNQLLNLINDHIQTFITTTSIDGLNHEVIDRASKFWIENGKIKEVNTWMK